MTRRNFTVGSLIGVVTAPLLAMIGCGTQTVIQILQLCVDAATAAIPTVAQAAGVSPATVALLLGYLQQVSQAVSGAATILNGTLPPAQKAAQIVVLFAGIVVPNLTGLPANIVSAIQLVAKYVAQLLASLPVPAGPGLVAPEVQMKVAITVEDQTHLAAIKAKAEVNLAAIAQIKR
jgi:hypothetical protein